MHVRLKDLLRSRRQMLMATPLACSICIFMDDNSDVEDAVTIVNGQAVCEDHIYLVRDNKFLERIEFAKAERR